MDTAPSERRLLAPEVIQTSAMDCGPAALKCLLEGFGIPVSYGRLREACQTDLDGTSIDAIEDVAVQLGLLAEQTMAPAEHLLLSAAELLPALVVTVQPNGLTHFVVVWRCHGRFVQVMDPVTGRRWPTQKQFLPAVYRHSEPVSMVAWRAWAGSAAFCEPLHQRLAWLGVEEPARTHLVDAACEDAGWRALGALDAATRLVTAMVHAGGLARGTEAEALVSRYFHQARQPDSEALSALPLAFWSVQPLPPQPGDASAADHQLLLQGAVLMRVSGRRTSSQSRPRHRGQTTAPDHPAAPAGDQPEAVPLTPGLMAALHAVPSRPEFEILRALRADGLLTPTLLALALALAAASVTGEAILYQGLLALGQPLGLGAARLDLLGGLCVLMLLLLLLELPIVATVLRLGRRLETRMRIAFLAKLPRLGDRYFHSRLTSDMAQRAYSLRLLRTIPLLGSQFLRLTCQFILTAGGIVWLAPESMIIVLLATLWAIGLALLTHPLLAERDMRVRTQAGALSRFYLDALLGLVPVRAHGAEGALQREHEGLIVERLRASQSFASAETLIQAVGALVSSGFAVWIVLHYLAQGSGTPATLLLLYWTLNLPLLGQWLVDVALQYSVQRNTLLRLLEPLGAPTEDAMEEDTPADDASGAVTTTTGADQPAVRAGQPPLAEPVVGQPTASPGVAIRLERVSVQAGGHAILRDINLTIQAGEHIAIVGPSGAGKTSLAGLLLGWHRPMTGQVLVDEVPLNGTRVQVLRQATAWVDPTVQLWNRSFLDNLRYGAQEPFAMLLSDAMVLANLLEVIDHLPNGLQTRLGEGGGLVSGGEGQRVRLARALLRPQVRLVILDEPFRGLDRPTRQQLLASARRHWQATTLICITHDVGETQCFDRVVVLEHGQVAEDAAPRLLVHQPESRYRALLEAEEAVRQALVDSTAWRRLWLAEGHLRER